MFPAGPARQSGGMPLSLESLEAVDKELAEKCPINQARLDEAIETVAGYFFTAMLKPEFAKLASDEAAKQFAKKVDPLFVFRLLIAAKRGLTKKQAAVAAQTMLDNIGKNDPKPESPQTPPDSGN